MSGLEIKPLGWLILAILIGLAIYFLIKWLNRPPHGSEGKIRGI
jgi:hypothetical protein